MAKSREFTSEDIGAELLQIITTGLYRDPLDALREYTQNAIDAGAHNVEVIIDHDVVTVRDDGTGMDREQAERAIRFGISDKNPMQNVGFRGIGIYSAFNICQRLEIHTRASKGAPTIIGFDFGRMRDLLEETQKRRLANKPYDMYLEKLLKESVSVGDDPEPPLAAAGTVVMLLGIEGNVQKRLTDRGVAKEYLEGVVPLPFLDDFHHKSGLESLFRKEDYPVVNVTLSVDGNEERLYRPYRNDMFAHGIGFGPKHYALGNVLAGRPLGFAWVCLNDARKYLPDKSLRGLVIKKFGFSVGGRDSFAKFFGRAVFNHRITGEIIVRHPDLLPNAARTDFEPGPVRDALYLALAHLAADISSWAERIQNELKAREDLEEISPRVFEIVKLIPSVERDVPELLKLNTELTAHGDTLKHHRSLLQKLAKSLYEKTVQALQQAQSEIKQILTYPEKRAKTRGKRIERALRLGAGAPTRDELLFARDKPRSLWAIASAKELDASAGMRLMLDYIDREVLAERLSAKEYAEILENLLIYLDENL